MKGNSLLDTLVIFVLIFAVLTAVHIYGMEYRKSYIADLCGKYGRFYSGERRFICQEIKEADHKNNIHP